MINDSTLTHSYEPLIITINGSGLGAILALAMIALTLTMIARG